MQRNEVRKKGFPLLKKSHPSEPEENLRFITLPGSQMNKQTEYRRYALDAQRQADHARRPSDKAAWLRIAQSWQSLLKAGGSAEEQFDATVATTGTGQEKSDLSH
jgi:hypothetical protein